MSRPAMRLLSTRLQALQRAPRLNASLGSVRASSRYSNPGLRPAIATPAQSPSFTGAGVDSSFAGISPLSPDVAAARKEQEAVRANALHRMRFASIGLLLSVVGLGFTVYNLDLDDIEKAGRKNKIQLDGPPDSNDLFQGRDVHVVGERVVAGGKDGNDELDLVQTGSGSVPYFPRRLYLPASEAAPSSPIIPGSVQDEYTLVGLGIRTVSIFSIEVYVMGMYVRTQDISAIQSRLIHLINPNASTLVPSEKEDLKARLLDPTASTDIWDTLLREEGIRSVWRVVPSKNTDFAHLRDGWINGIKRATNEVKAHLTAGPALTDYDNESFGSAIRDFKDVFKGGKAPKGSVLLLKREASGALEILFQDPRKGPALETVGKVQDPRIGRLIWIAYLAGKNPSSEPARKDVVDGYVGFAGRPLGSVETMVR